MPHKDVARRAFAALLYAGACLAPLHSFGQAATRSSTGTSPNDQVIPTAKEEVTVTGTRSAVELEKSPVSQAVVSREEIAQRDVRLIDKAIQDVPGVIAIRTKGGPDSDFGIGLRGFAGRGGQQRTLIMLDDQPINNGFIGSVNWAAISPFDIQRVEVARGPFSSLYGGNAMGGVINMLSRRPEARHGDFFYQFGSRASYNYDAHLTDKYFDRLGLTVGWSQQKNGGYSPQGIFSAPVTTTAVATPVTGVQQFFTNTGGAQYQIGSRGAQWFKTETLRGRAEYAFSSKVFAYIQYLHMHRGDGYGPYSTDLRNAGGTPIDTGTVSFFDAAGVVRKLTITPAAFNSSGPSGATTNLLHSQVTVELTPKWSIRLTPGLNMYPSSWYTTPGAGSTYKGGPGTSPRQFSQSIYANLLVNRTYRGRTLLFGTETRADRGSTVTRNMTNWTSRDTLTNLTLQAFGKTIDQSAYIQYQISPTDKLNVVAGGRFDYWKTYGGANQASATVPLLNYGDRSQHALTGKLAVNYELPKEWHIRGSIGNAFRGPTVYELYYNFVLSGVKYVANPAEAPEHLFAYEAGVVKTFHGKYSLEATGYTNRVRDLIYRTTDFATDPTGNTRVLTNAGKSRTWGTEISTRQRVLPWLDLRQGYTYTNSIIIENAPLPATVGKTLPYVPAHILTWGVSAHPKKFVLNLNGRYVSPLFSSDTNTDVVKGVPGSYSLFYEMDGTLSYAINKHFTAVVNADNMLDRSYFLFYRSQGRTLFAGVRAHF